MKDVRGRVAFVTGGVSGIGLAIAKCFANAGMKVAVSYRRSEKLDDAMRYFSRRPEQVVLPIRLDVTDRSAVAAACDEIERAFGEVHVLCNSAGVNAFGPLDGATFDDWDWIMDVNFNGVVNCLVTFLPRIKAHGQGGHVVNVASMSAFVPSVNAGIYATSKYAIRGLTECLRLSLAPHRIGVSLVCPGLTNTEIWQAPLRRPHHRRNSRMTMSSDEMNKLAEIQALGMDPMEVGLKTLRGVLRNELYILTHPEFAEELHEAARELLSALPTEQVDERRLAVERERARLKAERRRASDELE